MPPSIILSGTLVSEYQTSELGESLMWPTVTPKLKAFTETASLTEVFAT